MLIRPRHVATPQELHGVLDLVRQALIKIERGRQAVAPGAEAPRFALQAIVEEYQRLAPSAKARLRIGPYMRKVMDTLNLSPQALTAKTRRAIDRELAGAMAVLRAREKLLVDRLTGNVPDMLGQTVEKWKAAAVDRYDGLPGLRIFTASLLALGLGGYRAAWDDQVILNVTDIADDDLPATVAKVRGHFANQGRPLANPLTLACDGKNPYFFRSQTVRGELLWLPVPAAFSQRVTTVALSVDDRPAPRASDQAVALRRAIDADIERDVTVLALKREIGMLEGLPAEDAATKRFKKLQLRKKRAELAARKQALLFQQVIRRRENEKGYAQRAGRRRAGNRRHLETSAA